MTTPSSANDSGSKNESASTIHDRIFKQEKCFIHPQTPFSFYCFTDKKFICSACFKNHSRHNLEIKDDLIEKASLFSQILLSHASNQQIYFEKYIESLTKISQELEGEITRAKDELEKIKTRGPLVLSSAKSMFDLDYNEYKKLSSTFDNKYQVRKFSDKIQKVIEQTTFINYKNLRWISNEVKIINYSPFHEGFPPDVLLGKTKASYYLAEGTTNHMLTFDLGKVYFVKSIKIALYDFDCSLRNFIVSYTDDFSEWKELGRFRCEPFDKNVDYQEFQIGVETSKIKLDLLDNHGISGGPYILIKRIFFRVGDLL